ncbi:MAG: hypothetical protein FJX76_07115 [Armatimonadetes bacterium]|nr:hypothetical protein [Armatimonadota bacterium]
MDLDHIRTMVDADDVRFTDKFDRMLQARDFSWEQAREVVVKGRIIDEEITRGRSTKYVVQGIVSRARPVDVLIVEVAVTDVVIFISGYWPGDGPRQRK